MINENWSIYLIRLDLEPSRYVIDETKGEYRNDGNESVAHRANRVDLERKRDVDPPIDGHSARQIDRVELESGHHRMRYAIYEVDEILVGMFFIDVC